MSAFGHGNFKQNIYDSLSYVVNDEEDLDAIYVVSEIYTAVNRFCLDYMSSSDFIKNIEKNAAESARQSLLNKLSNTQ
jgi:hypothetical protein